MWLLYSILIAVAVLLAVLLATYSLSLLIVFLIVTLLSVLLILRWRSRGTSAPASRNISLSSGMGVPPVNHAQDARATFKLWTRLAIVLGTPLLCFALLSILGRWDFVARSGYGEWILFLLIALSWMVLLWGLFSISGILFFKRSQTGFPRWSVLLGIVPAFIAVVVTISPVIFFLLSGLGGGGVSTSRPRVPPNAFKIDQRIGFALEGDGQVTEHYDVEPKSHYAVVDLTETKSAAIPGVAVDRSQVFESGKFEKAPLNGLVLEDHRKFSASVQNLGLFRSKMTFESPDIALTVRNVSAPTDSDSQIEGDSEFVTSDASDFHRTITIDLPKNSYLASLPKGELVPLPDRDVLTISTTSPAKVELYYLRRGRLAGVASVLGGSSNHDLVLKVLAGVLWPSALLLIGRFHKSVADGVIHAGKLIFKRLG